MQKVIIKSKNLNTADSSPAQTTPKDTKIPSPPPPPAMNWRPNPVKNCSLQDDIQKKQIPWPQVMTNRHTQAPNNVLMEELLKAFKIFNVDANKTFKNTLNE